MSERISHFDRQLKVYVPSGMVDDVDDVAHKAHMTRSELIRFSINEELRRRRRRERADAA